VSGEMQTRRPWFARQAKRDTKSVRNGCSRAPKKFRKEHT
jgi:hypothetical protein